MEAMKLMIDSSSKIYLYKVYCINKHVPSHVDDKIFKTHQIKFTAHFYQEFSFAIYNVLTINDQNASQTHNHAVVNLDVMIAIWSVFFSFRGSVLDCLTFYNSSSPSNSSNTTQPLL